MPRRSPANARRALSYCSTVLARVEAQFEQLDRLIRQNRRGLQAARYDAVGVSTTPGDPTGNAAVHGDPVEAEMELLYDLVDRLWTETNNLVDLARRWDMTPMVRQPCANRHGCPDGKPAAPGRRSRCESCYRSLLRNGVDRLISRAA